jgi:hypothetical protein
MNIMVQQPSVAPSCIGRATDLVMAIMAKAEIVEDLGKLEIEGGNESRLSHHAQHLGAEMGDALCELLDMLSKEQSGQEA